MTRPAYDASDAQGPMMAPTKCEHGVVETPQMGCRLCYFAQQQAASIPLGLRIDRDEWLAKRRVAGDLNGNEQPPPAA